MLRPVSVCKNSNSDEIAIRTRHQGINLSHWHRMAHLLYFFLAIASISTTKPIDLTNPESILTPAAITSSFVPVAINESVKANNSTLAVSAPFIVCNGRNEEPDLVQDQCMEALVNSDFASLPPTQPLTFAARSPSLPIGSIGLPRRYLSCI